MLKYKDENLYRSICDTKTLQSQQKGFFLEFANNILSKVQTNWVTNIFSKCQNDQQRIQSIFGQNQIRENISDVLKHVHPLHREKNATVSHDRRLQAEKMYSEGADLEKVLMVFGQAVLRAPGKEVDVRVDGGFSLPFALWKRSEVLIDLKHYNLALSDLQLALKEGLPAKHTAELYWRMARCYMGLGELKKAKVSYGLADRLETDQTKKQSMKEDQEEKIDPIQDPILKPEIVVKEESIEWKSGSKLLKMAETQKLGRFFVANEEIVPGDVLVAEDPYAACLMPDFFGSNCHHCFKKLIAPIGCTNCSGVAFCSLSCREEALNSYHKFECKIMDFLIGSGMSVLCHLALRMITKFDLSACLQKHKQKSILPIYKLCALAKQRDIRDLLYRTLMAVFLVRCLQISDYFPTDNIGSLSEDEFKVAELLLMHLQFLQFNAHEIMEVRKTLRGDKLKEVPVAIAVYPTASIFNHDCYPSVVRFFDKNKLILIANKVIKPGEMVSENYGPIFTHMSREERQVNLQSRYWFKCECQACILCWPEVSDVEEDFAQLRCPTEKCKGAFILPDISGKCSKCKQEPDLNEALVQLTECENIYRQGSEQFEERDYENAVNTYLEGLNIFHRIGTVPHLETLKAEENLKTCYMFLYNPELKK